MGNCKVKVSLRRNILTVWDPADPGQTSGHTSGMQELPPAPRMQPPHSDPPASPLATTRGLHPRV